MNSFNELLSVAFFTAGTRSPKRWADRTARLTNDQHYGAIEPSVTPDHVLLTDLADAPLARTHQAKLLFGEGIATDGEAQ